MWLIIAIVAVLLLVAGYLIAKNHTKPPTTFETSTGTATANPDVPGKQDATPATGTSGSKDEGDNSPGQAPAAGVQPAAPTGEFVSYHTPNLSGSPGPNTETSVCTTTPGAQCKITFTSGSVVKSLPAQATDANGNTLWNNWKLQSIGLTKGTWTVKAVAINGSKSATATDVTPLTISP